jgi:hypothetical protein
MKASVDFTPQGKEQLKKDHWKYRRLFMLWQMLFCNLVIVYVLFADKVTKIAEFSVDYSFLLMGTVILAYVFGATIEDISKLKLRK